MTTSRQDAWSSDEDLLLAELVLSHIREASTQLKAFEEAGLVPEVQEIVMKALNETELEGKEAETMKKMLEALEALDDVQEVYTTAVMDETE